MNVADARRMASVLEQLGYHPTSRAEEADIIVMVTCVVRQSAEDKAVGRLHSLRPLKKKNPNLVIHLMGCLVGTGNNQALQERFPYVDVFSAPSDFKPLVSFLLQREGRHLEEDEVASRFAMLDGEMPLPSTDRNHLVSTYISIMNGCSHACAYCIIPYRRGAEVSRLPQDILAEARSLAQQGVKEVTLLGQIVDRYGKDLPGTPTLAGLLRQLHDIKGLERIRFLTSHPNWMTDELMAVVAELPRVMPHIEVPVQAGDDEVLKNMRRGYTASQYYSLVERLRQTIPGVSIATDIIVGFPGETEAQFQNTYNLLAELKMDVVHLARYSPRQGTLSARTMPDDVPDDEKWRRFRLLEDLQKSIAVEINAAYQGRMVPVLFEDVRKGRWLGRTPTNKLVFVEDDHDLLGKVIPVEIVATSPWSMQAKLTRHS